jgi:hypothetical protein
MEPGVQLHSCHSSELLGVNARDWLKTGHSDHFAGYFEHALIAATLAERLFAS